MLRAPEFYPSLYKTVSKVSWEMFSESLPSLKTGNKRQWEKNYSERSTKVCAAFTGIHLTWSVVCPKLQEQLSINYTQLFREMVWRGSHIQDLLANLCLYYNKLQVTLYVFLIKKWQDLLFLSVQIWGLNTLIFCYLPVNCQYLPQILET